MCGGVGGGQRGDIDGVANGLITRGVDHVAEGLLGVLNAASLGVPVAQEDQLLLLPRPQASHTLPVHLRKAVRGWSLTRQPVRRKGNASMTHTHKLAVPCMASARTKINWVDHSSALMEQRRSMQVSWLLLCLNTSRLSLSVTCLCL